MQAKEFYLPKWNASDLLFARPRHSKRRQDDFRTHQGARAVKFGGFRGLALTPEARQAGCKAVQARADAFAADIAPTIADIQAGGARSLRDFAAELNARGVPTATGTGEWQAQQVARVLARL